MEGLDGLKAGGWLDALGFAARGRTLPLAQQPSLITAAGPARLTACRPDENSESRPRCLAATPVSISKGRRAGLGRQERGQYGQTEAFDGPWGDAWRPRCGDQQTDRPRGGAGIRGVSGASAVAEGPPRLRASAETV